MPESEQKPAPPLETWAVLEMMGHIKLAGKVSEETHFGVVMGRIDIPLDDGKDMMAKWLTQFFGGSAVFRLTPCDEATARAVAARSAPAPIQPYEMPRQLSHAEEHAGAGYGPNPNPAYDDEMDDREDDDDEDDEDDR